MPNEIKQNYYDFCLRCGRRLKKVESQTIGMGKVCIAKTKMQKVIVPLFEMSKEDVNTDLTVSHTQKRGGEE